MFLAVWGGARSSRIASISNITHINAAPCFGYHEGSLSNRDLSGRESAAVESEAMVDESCWQCLPSAGALVPFWQMVASKAN